ncbi:MAG: hypothetical protein ACRESF_01910 [Pseudomonas sp.]
MEAKLYELLGRAEAAHKGLLEDYRQVLHLLIAIQAGQLDPARLVIDLAGLSWQVLPEARAVSIPVNKAAELLQNRLTE